MLRQLRGSNQHFISAIMALHALFPGVLMPNRPYTEQKQECLSTGSVVPGSDNFENLQEEKEEEKNNIKQTRKKVSSADNICKQFGPRRFVQPDLDPSNLTL